jgi:hypothetical protein
MPKLIREDNPIKGPTISGIINLPEEDKASDQEISMTMATRMATRTENT